MCLNFFMNCSITQTLKTPKWWCCKVTSYSLHIISQVCKWQSWRHRSHLEAASETSVEEHFAGDVRHFARVRVPRITILSYQFWQLYYLNKTTFFTLVFVNILLYVMNNIVLFVEKLFSYSSLKCISFVITIIFNSWLKQNVFVR